MNKTVVRIICIVLGVLMLGTAIALIATGVIDALHIGHAH